MIFFYACGSSGELQTAPEDLPIMDEQLLESTESDESESEMEKSEQEIRAENELRDSYQIKVNRLTNFYARAQQLFYNGQHEDALFLIRQAEEVQINADVLALKGNIHYGLGNFDVFESSWRQALEMDENVPLPLIPTIIRALQNRGLLDENLKKNF